MSKRSDNIWTGVKIVGAGIAAYALYEYISSDDDSSLDLNVNNRKLSYASNWYKLKADEIQKHLWAVCIGVFLCENDSAAAEILMMLKNDEDWYKLHDVYGKRDSGDWMLDWAFEDMTLTETIAAYLNDSNKLDVNADWEAKGMESRLT